MNVIGFLTRPPQTRIDLFGRAFHGWSYEPLTGTDRAAKEILARMDARAANP